MKIWIFNNYNMLPEHGHLNRHYHFGRWLERLGCKPVVFVGSHPHNTDLQLIEGPEPCRVYQEEPFPWILVKTLKYGGSRKKQVLSMFQFYRNGKAAARYAAERYGEPDVILGSSAHPLAAVLAIRLGKRYGCRSIVEIRDLWPESIVAYGIAGPRSPLVIALRRLEKWIYKKADAVVFTMEGAYDYIVEQGWEADVPRSKVSFINNGVDLEAFERDRIRFRLDDPDLDDPDTVKVVYTGSIRLVNDLDVLVDAAKRVKDPRIRFLIWGEGDRLPALRRRVRDEGIGNVVFKGGVEKKYIPSIVSRADYNYINGADNDIFRFGISPNKLFEYFAAGKPVLMCLRARYDPARRFSCGLICETPAGLDALLEEISDLPAGAYDAFCRGAKEAAREYDFQGLARKLLDVIEGGKAT